MSLLHRNRWYRRLWAGETVSLLGDQVTALALPLIAVVTLGVSTFQFSVLTAASWVPYLFALPIGTLTDRLPVKRWALIAADLVRAAALMSLPLASWFARVNYVHLLTVALVVGLAAVVSQTSYTAFFVRVVDSEDVLDANSLNSTSRSVASLVGPPVAGALIQMLRATIAIVVDVVSYVVSALTLAGMRVEHEQMPAAPRKPLAREAVEGLRALFGNRLRVSVLACVSTMNITSYAVLGVLMVVLVRDLHLNGATIGLAQGIGAAGAVLGAVLAPRAVRRFGLFRVVAAGVLLGGPPMLAIAAIPGDAALVVRVGVVSASLVLVWLGIMLFDIPVNAVLLRITPDHLRGRIVGAFSSINYGTRPVGAVLGGLLGQSAGPRVTLALAAGLSVLAIVPLLTSELPGATSVEDVPDANAALAG